MTVALIAHRRTPTNVAFSEAWPETDVLEPGAAVESLGEGDVAIGRLDVSASLDGIELGLWELARLEGAGVRVLNGPRALIAAHDKLATARALTAAGLPHPRTVHVDAATSPVPIDPPVVVKPRFGSWGLDVVLCADAPALRRHLAEIAERPWFQAQGALVQELIPPRGHDLRLVVAGNQVVGAVRRVAAPGEWRTNVALGARREPVSPDSAAYELALASAGALEADLVGVDLLPRDGSHVVVELNGAVEFTAEYALDSRDIFEVTMEALLSDRAAAVA